MNHAFVSTKIISRFHTKVRRCFL